MPRSAGTMRFLQYSPGFLTVGFDFRHSFILVYVVGHEPNGLAADEPPQLGTLVGGVTVTVKLVVAPVPPALEPAKV